MPSPERHGFFLRDLRNLDRERLGEAIRSTEVDLDRRRRRAAGSASSGGTDTKANRDEAREGEPAWVMAAQADLRRSSELWEQRQFDAGWSALSAARREIICSFDETELQAEATRLLLEAGDKLDGWRAAFVKTATRSVIGGSAPEVAGDSANLGDEPEGLLEELSVKEVLDPLGERSEKGVDEVLVMAQVRQRRKVGIEDQRVWLKAASCAVDDHFGNVFRRQRLRRHQLVWGSIALVATIFRGTRLGGLRDHARRV